MLYRSTVLNANLTKGAASSADVLELLRLWGDDEAPSDFERRVIDENLLGKTSRNRARDVVKSVLHRRFFPEGARQPATNVFRLAVSAAPRDVVLSIMYYHTALAEHLLYVVSSELLYDLHCGGMNSVTATDVVRFLRSRLSASRRIEAYSDAVLEKLAQSALTTLRDFGILEGKVRKRVAPFRVPHQVVGYVAYALHNEGHTPRRIIEHADWRLFLLSPVQVEDAVIEAAAHGHLTYSAAGEIRRFDWHYPDLAAYTQSITADAFAQAAS